MKAWHGGPVFDGARLRRGVAVLAEQGAVLAVVPEGEIPEDAERIDLGGDLLAPGFVDLQVNGGDGIMFGDAPTVETLARIAAAHRRLGTAWIMPTLITAPDATVAAAIDAAAEAVRTVPGVIGLHLEGPHLAPARRGVHRAALMRPLGEAEVERLVEARARIGHLMVTLAPEQAPPALIRRLADAGAIVSLGHSDCTYAQARAAFDAGARAVTHLFNAMSPLAHREPGLVGAALDAGEVWCGVIADGHHVHPATLAAAIRAKRGPGRLFAVSDAMAVAGTELQGFDLAGVPVQRRGGRLTLADGTLAGADIDMAGSLRGLTEGAASIEEALRMTSTYPARLLGQGTVGIIAAGAEPEFARLQQPPS